MPGVLRWKFKDLKTNEVWTVPLNPDNMTSPYPQRKYVYNSTTAGPAGTTVTHEAHSDPVSWQFSGQILDRDHFDKLLYWSRKKNRIQITDHYGRIFIVLLDQFNVLPKRAYGKPWRHTYTMTASVYSTADAP